MIRGFRRQDSGKARGCRIAVIIGLIGHISLRQTQLRIRDYCDIYSSADGYPFPVHSLDDSADPFCDAVPVKFPGLFVFYSGQIGEHNSRMDDRIGILQ